MTRSITLARYTMSAGGLATAGVVASSPQTVLVGGIPTTYAATGVAGVPLAFLLVTAVVAILAVGYVAVGRHVRHGAPFFAQVAHGLGPTAGLMAAGVAIVGYNALQISLYGLLGTTLVALFGGTWWCWAAAAWLIVLMLGQFPGAANARVLGFLLGLEIAVIILFILAGFSHPASGSVSMTGLHPSSLLVAGAAAPVVVFSFAAMAGTESLLAYAEEAKSPHQLAWAAAVVIGGCGTLYCLSAWSYGEWIGVDNLRSGAAAEQTQPLALLDTMYGPLIAGMATLLLVTSVLAAQSSFHNSVARYVFALARERALPAAWAAVSPGAKGGAPRGGSAVQAVTAAVVLAVFVVAGADPMRVMFTWLSTIGAFSVLLLLTVANWSALRFFERGRGRAESVWVRRVFPSLGRILGVLAAVFMAGNLGMLLGTPPGSLLPWLVAVPVGAAALAGLVAGNVLRGFRPEIHRSLGHGVPAPERVLDADLAELEL